jgi:gliding motility-associated-like protein
MKKILFVLIFSVICFSSFANHIVGGEVFYRYLGPGSQPNTSSYEISLRLFTTCGQVCGPGTNVACPPTNPIIGIFFNTSPYQRVRNVNLTKTGEPQISLTTYPPCISNQPVVCYQVNTYSTTVELDNNTVGYRLAYQNCCRATALNVPNTNTLSTSGQHGAAYEATLPGTNILPSGNNSICYNTFFTLEFSADDSDGDSLSYQFISAYDGGSFTGGLDTRQPDNPLYQNIPYTGGFSGSSPLGNTVTINPQTGLISGISPNNIGLYVVNVRVREWRNGINIAEHRKDFLVKVNDCQVPEAKLDPKATTCDGFLVNFENDNPSTVGIQTYFWDFGDPGSGPNNTSTSPTPTHDYTLAGAGDYKVKLVVNLGLPCEDTDSVIVKVYPGFRPAFEVLGQCKNTAIQFNDLSVHDFGTINKWTWNFGDPASGANNTSTLKNPTHIFATSGTYRVTLLVESDKGCSQLIPKDVEVKDKPAFTIPRDTLICTIDTLQLTATGTGTIVWSPNYMISDVNSLTPLVSPDVTTTYTATFTDAFGCSGTDDITINVVDRVTQGNNYDTTVCTGDAAQLRLFSNALYYTWTPNDGSLNSTTIKNPTATPTVATSYNVIGKISDKCFAQNTINVTPVPYPNVVAPDVSVCFGRSTQLQASGGTIYNWSPRTYLNSTTIANPTVTSPVSSVLYTLTVRDVLGCPKPVQKLVKLNVVKINANAGPRDTSVVLGQPLQLNATGGTSYVWLPDNRWLSSTTINNPVALPQSDIEYIVQVSDVNGCTGLDSIRVRLFRVAPGLYVPNAFTPNGDGKNDIFRPVVLGIKSLDLFQVYNRFGQMVYSGTDIAKGWDGTFGGRPQDPANFVWIAEATDYTGKKIKRKGNVILIRQ